MASIAERNHYTLGEAAGEGLGGKWRGNVSEQAHDFEALVERSRMIANKLGEQALWKAAVGLEAWYFIGSGPEGDQAPLIGSLEGKAYLLVFTDEEKAADFLKRQQHRKSDVRGGASGGSSGAGSVLNMEVADAIEYARQLKEAGVEGALFKSGGFAFQSSLIELIDRHHRYAG